MNIYVFPYLMTQTGITLVVYKNRSVLRETHFHKPVRGEDTRVFASMYSNLTCFGTVQVPIWEANQGLRVVCFCNL